MKKFLFIILLIFIISNSFIFAENIIDKNKDLLNDNIIVDIDEQVKMIPFEKPIVGKREKQLINEVIDSDGIGSGKYVKQFEEKFAKLSGAKYGIACSNGTTALHTALLAYGIKPGDKVITTPFSFIASANPILYCGAKPIFADIDEKTFNIDPKSVEKILKKEKNVKAVVCVHLFGLSCDMDKLLKLKKKYNFILIEDACQAHLAKYKNKFVGSIGDAGVFSFQATKKYDYR